MNYLTISGVCNENMQYFVFLAADGFQDFSSAFATYIEGQLGEVREVTQVELHEARNFFAQTKWNDPSNSGDAPEMTTDSTGASGAVKFYS